MDTLARTILVVDDDADARRIARTWLEGAGRRVLEAADGRECVRVAHDERPDAILLDLILPDVDGWEAARTLRADPATAGIPILGLTGLAFPVLRKRAVEAGCDVVLTKPVSPTRLLQEIDSLYGNTRERVPEPMR
ncbi:MAG TPA: response regulator [Longimicrobiales bacterium]